MTQSANSSLGLVALLVAATLTGCVGVGTFDSPDAETTDVPTTGQSSTTDSIEETGRSDTTTIETTVQAPSNATAKERAIDAEEARVGSALNASTVSGSVGGYDDPDATVVGRSDGGVRVRVSIPYSYSYDCEGRAGAVDLSAEATYRVSDDAVRLVEVHESVRLLC